MYHKPGLAVPGYSVYPHVYQGSSEPGIKNQNCPLSHITKVIILGLKQKGWQKPALPRQCNWLGNPEKSVSGNDSSVTLHQTQRAE